jgi:membrane-bound lytic murein transglycosylase D
LRKNLVIISLVGAVAFLMHQGIAASQVTEDPLAGEAKSLESDEANPTEDADAVAPDMTEKKRRWQAPDYAAQGPALGYKEDTFAIPEAMKPRVQFWMDIYTKYSSDQGVLHDSLHVGAIYEPIDFVPIMADANLGPNEKAKARKKLLEEKKNIIKDRLMSLHQQFTKIEGRTTVALSEDELKTKAAALTGEDLRVYNMFLGDEDVNKFKLAAQKGRLRFQLGQRDKFIQGIYYSGRYLRDMEKVFHEAGLPIEITRLPFVESSFNVKARSRVGASGIWQFMRYTGRKFMRISGASDERNDPMKATRSAARILRINYEMLQSWPLAITGYNHGPAGVSRMVKKFKTDDISELVDERHGRFGFASASFYASFLAAVHVEREAEKHFGKVYWDSPVPTEEILAERPVNKKMLVEWFKGDVEKAKEYNLHLTRTFWSGYGSLGPKDFVRVPADYAVAIREDLRKSYQRAGKTLASAGDITADAVEGIEYYVIGPGETLSEIASQFGLSISKLLDLNEIQNPRRIRAGQKIMVPKK